MYGRFCILISLVVLCLVAVRADIDQTTTTSASYTTTGDATVASSGIQVTANQPSQAGISLYSTPQTIANGFVTTFTYSSTQCASPGADGFTFVISPTPLVSTYGSGNNLAIVGAMNVGVIAFDLWNSKLYVCATNAATPLAWASCNSLNSLTPELRCSSHTIQIAFSPPNEWKISIDGVSKGTFMKDMTNTLTTVDGSAYVGFTGSTGPSYYMRQRVTAWTFTSAANCSVSNGGCSVDATCAVVSGARQCTCNPGFTGDGVTCTSNSPISSPVATPVAAPVVVPPVAEPVAAPIDPPITPIAPPVTPPVEPPVYIEPPVDVPIAQPTAAPVTPPVEAPVSQPVATPVTSPVSAPVTAPVTPPTTAPITPPVTPPVPVPVSPPVAAMPVIIPILECFDDLQNGSFIAYFGYNNTMNERVSLPVGSMNTFGSPSFIGQPSSFEAGRSDYYPNAAFAYLWNGKTLTWTLTSFRLTLDTSDTSRKCPSFARFTLTFYTERVLTDQEVNAISTGLAGALGISPERVRVLSIKYTPVTRKRDLSVAELEMEIAAANSTQQNEPSSSQAVQTLVETSKNTTALTQVLDPDGTSNLQVIGVKPAPTGVEQSGSGSESPSQEPISKSPRGLLMGQLSSGVNSELESRFVFLLFIVATVTLLVSV